ncbi:hypothetical protein B0T10DRAFT_482658 [Thelonectria olida]|uniref:Fun14 family protein n=1 Tax=Thelonectria olida TaxID=1576542 RepID=A0A9P9ASM4_9HYPO|nr:hypothetical protein B0T10DRAFT_482658 [Thelonectria olida]
MNRIFASRATFRAVAAGIGPAACAGSLLANRRAIRCDAPSLAASPPPRHRRSPTLDLSPETVAQISSGSVAGFGVGLVVTLFSRTLAFLSGLVGLCLHIASRSGVDVPRMLGVQKYLDGNELWEKTKGKPWFTASFLATFLLATVMRI